MSSGFVMTLNNIILPLSLMLIIGSVWLSAADQPVSQAQRDEFQKAFAGGNYKVAYEGFRKLALDPKDDPARVAGDLQTAISGLQQLGRIDEIDEFREAVVEVHKGNWRLLDAAAQSYMGIDHQGFIVAGKFQRGPHRGGGTYANAAQRDRVRALQLMQAALPLAVKDNDHAATGQFFLRFAQHFLSGAGQSSAWRLQTLTDLGQLPDLEEGYFGYGGSTTGAPVDPEGNPVLHRVPVDFESAQSDGERWRWLLSQAVEFSPSLINESQFALANFLREQFGVQTMARFALPFGSDDETKKDESGTYALSTLTEEETIARLATGIKRFKLPDEFNFIRLYQEIAARGKSGLGEQCVDALAQIFEDRRQYVKAAAAWQRAINEYGAGPNDNRRARRNQIVGNWGRFDNVQTQPAGKGATVEFRFRNANRVSFEAAEVNVDKLLTDVKAYLKSSPNQLDWNKTNIADIGSRLVQQNEMQYVGPQVATWNLDLAPRPNHVDDRITVTTPLQKPGAYLVTAKLPGGNVSRIILWVADTVIAKKQLDGKAFYYVADAATGLPVAKANVEFFGFKQVQVAPNKNEFKTVVASFAEFTNAEGQVILDRKKLPQDHQWLITARADKGRFAYLGFSGVWYNNYHDAEYNQTKVFTITDRPVYRPGQTVKFKFWIEHAKYDQADTSSFGKRPFKVQILNPKQEKVLDQDFTTDEFGGLDGEFLLPRGTTLGIYQVFIVNHGGGSFRVEEYKKPEFDVKVEAPKEPVSLGEKITATIQAKYFFGAPVVKAKVKYRVLRNNYSGVWHPPAPWDWFYGKGYWWFAYDYAWYP